MRALLRLIPVALVLTASIGCGSTATTTTDSTTATGSSYLVVGRLAAAVNGVPQSVVHVFLTGGSGTATLTLTSASEAMLDGTALTTVPLGLGLGVYANGTCTLLPDASVTTASGSPAQLTTTVPAGSGCLKVWDVTTQEGIVSYTVTLTHP